MAAPLGDLPAQGVPGACPELAEAFYSWTSSHSKFTITIIMQHRLEEARRSWQRRRFEKDVHEKVELAARDTAASWPAGRPAEWVVVVDADPWDDELTARGAAARQEAAIREAAAQVWQGAPTRRAASGAAACWEPAGSDAFVKVSLRRRWWNLI